MNDGKAILSTSSKHTLWGNELNNPFKDVDYSLLVLDDKLYPLFEKHNYPTAILITQLLKVTSGFLHATEFAQSSAESKNEKDLTDLFNSMTIVFNNTQNAISQEAISPNEQTILNSAIQYCKILIVQSLFVLQKIPNNKVFNFYLNSCNDLQNILSNIKFNLENHSNHTRNFNR